MIKISEGQATVLELLRKGVRRSVIAKQLGKHRSAVYATVDRLIDLGLVSSDEDGKPVVVDEMAYQVRKRKSAAVVMPMEPRRPELAPSVALSVPITLKQAAYIRQHVETKPRRQMARELGVDKVTLNMMIMQLRRVETS